MNESRRYLAKRCLDLTLTMPGLLVLSPVLGLLALLVRTRLGSPVLFRQVRPGRGERPFIPLKFRTMTDKRDELGAPLPDGERLTPLGRFLRRFSLDELPELFNVLRGDMSLVGPRPLLLRYSPYFTKEERVRFGVPPGITGLAQISGRNDLSWDERIAADVRYVRERSLLLDLKILLLTLVRVLARHGLQVNPRATMLDFDEERQARTNRTLGRTLTC